MKKSILALAILSTLSTAAFADDISYGDDMTAGEFSTIDLFQVPFAEDGETPLENAGGDTFTLTSGAVTQMNIITGTDAGSNEVTVDQSAATKSIANVFLNATVEDTSTDEAPRGIGAGSTVTGKIADITLAQDNILGKLTEDDTTANIVDLTQAGTDGVAGVAIAGSANTVSLIQEGAMNIAQLSVDGTENVISVTQSAENTILNMFLHASADTITIVQ